MADVGRGQPAAAGWAEWTNLVTVWINLATECWQPCSSGRLLDGCGSPTGRDALREAFGMLPDWW